MSHDHYHKNVSHLSSIDVYRVLDLFGVTSPSLQHAIKKLLCAGGRGAKSDVADVREAMDSLTRWQQMRIEDEAQAKAVAFPPIEPASGCAKKRLDDLVAIEQSSAYMTAKSRFDTAMTQSAARHS